MLMKVMRSGLADVLIMEPKVFGEARGFFPKSFSQNAFDDAVGRHHESLRGKHSRSVSANDSAGSSLRVTESFP